MTKRDIKGSLDWKHGLLAITSLIFAGLFITQKVTFDDDARQCSDIIPNIAIVNKSESYDLALYVDQVIRGATSQYSHFNIVDNIGACRGMGLPAYALEYTIFQDETTFRSTLSIVSDEDADLVASQNLAGDLKSRSTNNETVSDDLYYNLVTVVNDWLKPNGVIHRDSVKQVWNSEEKYKDYSCVIIMYESFVSDSNADYEKSLKCLEESYSKKTPILDNLGGLATSYIEQHQGVRPATINDPLRAAETIVQSVGNDWDQNVETIIAKIYFEAERKDYNSQRMKRVLQTAEERYGSNPIILLEVAKHAGFRLGDWEYAKRVSDRAKRVQTGRDNSVFFVDSAYALFFQNNEDRIDECTKTYSENSLLSNLVINACATLEGDSIWIDLTESNLDRLGIDSNLSKINFVKQRAYDDSFKRALEIIWSTPK